MPPNSQQRAIFVYLRSKDDHKSCTPAGVKLTDEYTHRNNKNHPSTISVTPPQLCTFFRKRTIYCRLIVRSSRRTVVFQRWKATFLPLETYFSEAGKFLETSRGGFFLALLSPTRSHAIRSTPEEIWIVYAGNGESPRRNGKILRNFDFFLPKFHFILPKFYIPSPWKTKDLHRGVADFLGGD